MEDEEQRNPMNFNFWSWPLTQRPSWLCRFAAVGWAATPQNQLFVYKPLRSPFSITRPPIHPRLRLLCFAFDLIAESGCPPIWRHVSSQKLERKGGVGGGTHGKGHTFPKCSQRHACSGTCGGLVRTPQSDNNYRMDVSIS